MLLFGIDVSNYQSGIDMGEVAREGFAFCFVKATEGGGYVNGSFGAQLAGASQSGMLVAAYHYLTTDPVGSQVANLTRVIPPGLPVCVDVEKGSGDVANARAFIDAVRAAGHNVPLLYLPQWYWQQIGSPDLSGLPPLWSSKYPTTNPAPASVLYQGVPQSYWNGYGGGNVAVLQFADSAQVAGRQVDASAYLGSRDELAALLGGGGEPDMQLSDRWIDKAGNPQDVQTTFERVNALWNIFLNPGSVVAHDSTHTHTDGLDLLADEGSWILQLMAQVSAIQGALSKEEADLLGAVKGIQAGAVDVNALAAALGPLLPKSVTADDLVAALAKHLSTPATGA